MPTFRENGAYKGMVLGSPPRIKRTPIEKEKVQGGEGGPRSSRGDEKAADWQEVSEGAAQEAA